MLFGFIDKQLYLATSQDSKIKSLAEQVIDELCDMSIEELQQNFEKITQSNNKDNCTGYILLLVAFCYKLMTQKASFNDLEILLSMITKIKQSNLEHMLASKINFIDRCIKRHELRYDILHNKQFVDNNDQKSTLGYYRKIDHNPFLQREIAKIVNNYIHNDEHNTYINRNILYEKLKQYSKDTVQGSFSILNHFTQINTTNDITQLIEEYNTIKRLNICQYLDALDCEEQFNQKQNKSSIKPSDMLDIIKQKIQQIKNTDPQKIFIENEKDIFFIASKEILHFPNNNQNYIYYNNMNYKLNKLQQELLMIPLNTERVSQIYHLMPHKSFKKNHSSRNIVLIIVVILLIIIGMIKWYYY
jgi:hypothetical protein